MLVLFITSLFAVFLAYFESINCLKNGLKLGVVLITIIASIRFSYGNDWDSYQYMFETQSLYNVSWDNFREYRAHEPGWVLINWFFEKLGFQYLIISITIFQSSVIYKIIKYFVPKQLYHIALFVYLFDTSFFVLGLSMLRQSFAMTLVALALIMVFERKKIVSILIILIATTIHQSSIIMLPMILIDFIPNKIKFCKMIVYLIIGMFALCFLLPNVIGNTILPYLESNKDLNQYTDYIGGDIATYGLGFLVSLIPFVLSLKYIYQNFDNPAFLKKIVIITCVGFIIIPLGQIVAMINRLAFYFLLFQIVAIPISYYNLKNRKNRNFLMMIYVIFTIFNYINFFNNPVWIEDYMYYKTIF